MHADCVFLNGRIYTMDPGRPLAQAVAVRCGRVVEVGDNDRVRALAGRGVQELDLQGRTVLPGFTDSHLHLVWYGLSLRHLQLDGIPTLEEVVERVAERARSARPGEWIRGRGWNRNLWPGAPFPHKWDLDPVTPRNPVFLPGKDGHSAWANSLALDLAGIHRDTPDPAGGEIERDPETGQPTGLLKEGPAMNLVQRAAGEPDLSEKMQAVRSAATSLNRMGIVGVHTPEEEHDFSALQDVWREGELPLRVNVMVTERWLAHAVQMGLHGGLGDEFLRASCIKVFADGALGSRTADMWEDYEGEPDNRGIEVTDSKQLAQLVAEAVRGKWNVAIHAIGDRANHRVLGVLEGYNWRETGLRPRIEHAQLLAAEDIPRFGRIGVVASMQPIHCTSDMLMAEKHWGPRCSGAYAWRSLLGTGAVLAFGSDAPVEEPDVLRGLFAAVTRKREGGSTDQGWHPELRLSISEAVYAYTMGAAYASGDERNRGSLSVGKCADMVVLSHDIMQSPPESLLNARVEATVLGGNIVYGA